MSDKAIDEVQVLLSRTFKADMPFKRKMEMLDVMEPIIEEAYELGLTSVKPVRLMTVDDFIDVESS